MIDVPKVEERHSISIYRYDAPDFLIVITEVDKGYVHLDVRYKGLSTSLTAKAGDYYRVRKHKNALELYVKDKLMSTAYEHPDYADGSIDVKFRKQVSPLERLL